MVGGRASKVLLGLLAFALIMAGCTADPDRVRPLDGWTSVALPAGMVPATLGRDGNWLLVGGQVRRGEGRFPALVRLRAADPESAPEPVSVTPRTPYGKVADLVALTGAGDRVVALGAAHGGAHANFRWTVWTGSVEGVTDRPQSFETFGGQEAGTLLGLATDARSPLLVGTWQGAHGADGAIWRPSGERSARWVRERPAPALTSTARRQMAPRSVSQQDDGSVTVNGSVIDLGDGVRQSAATWRDQDGDWTLAELPDPGERSEAWSTACAVTCWTVGARDGQLAIWSGTGRVEVPLVTVDDSDSARVLVARDSVVMVASSGEDGRLLIGSEDRWRVYTAPGGLVRAAALVGSRLYLISGAEGRTRLWTRDLGDLLSG